jgi:hypothetical protein
MKARNRWVEHDVPDSLGAGQRHTTIELAHLDANNQSHVVTGQFQWPCGDVDGFLGPERDQRNGILQRKTVRSYHD